MRHIKNLLRKRLLYAHKVSKLVFGEDNEEYSLLTLINCHNTQMSTSLTYGTLKNYFTTQKYIKLFLTDKRKIQDVYLSQITFRFVVNFYNCP